MTCRVGSSENGEDVIPVGDGVTCRVGSSETVGDGADPPVQSDLPCRQLRKVVSASS